MTKLLAGYRKFKSEVFPQQKHRFKLLADRQKPETLFITCSDSRVVPDLITQSEPGDLFICRVVGNLVPTYGSAVGGVSSAIEYAVMVLDVSQIIICGHSDCGAMKAFLNPEKLDGLPAVKAWLQHATTAITVANEQHAHLQADAFTEALIQENIASQLNHLTTHPCVAARMRAGKLTLHGWYYDIGTGDVSSYDEGTGHFVPLDVAVEANLGAAVR